MAKNSCSLFQNSLIWRPRHSMANELIPQQLRSNMDRRESYKQEVKWISHYNSSQNILLVGEGDFSFSACLATAFGSAWRMVATSLDSKCTLERKHGTSKTHLQNLKSRGCLVLHGVNVHDMNRHPILSQRKFDVVVFNFPHAGHSPPLREQDSELIKRHRKLVQGFLKNAREILSEGGEVHVTHRDDYPYNRWNLKQIAEKSGYFLKEKVEFRKEDYPGYRNRRGGGIKSNQKFPIKQSFTYKFSVAKKSTEVWKFVGNEFGWILYPLMILF